MITAMIPKEVKPCQPFSDNATLRGSDNSDWTGLETSKIRNP